MNEMIASEFIDMSYFDEMVHVEGFGWAPLIRDCKARYPERVWIGLKSNQTDDKPGKTGN